METRKEDGHFIKNKREPTMSVGKEIPTFCVKSNSGEIPMA